MESQSQNQAQRRRRGNRQGGRTRNRQSSQSSEGTKASGGRSRNRNRNRNRNQGGSGSRQPEPTALQKFLATITFGLLGRSKAKPARKPATKTARPARSEKSPKPVAAPAQVESRKSSRNRAEVTSGRLYVGNLDYSTGEAELEELFRGVGNVLRAEVVTNPRTQQSKGFAFVEMGSMEEAKRAVSILDDQDFMGRKLIVSGARSEGQPEEGGESALTATASEGLA